MGRLFRRRRPGPYGAGRVSTTVWASTFLTARGCPFTRWLLASGPSDFGSYRAWKVKTTSSAVNGMPSGEHHAFAEGEGVGPAVGVERPLGGQRRLDVLSLLIELHQASVDEHRQRPRRAIAGHEAVERPRLGAHGGDDRTRRRRRGRRASAAIAEEQRSRDEEEHDQRGGEQATRRWHKGHSLSKRTGFTHVGQPASLGASCRDKTCPCSS